MKKRNFSLDLLRVFAILGVVAIHADVITSSPTNYLGGVSWWFANTIHSLASASVPLFVMLTGALVLHKPKVPYSYILPKVITLFISPFLIWWGFYSWWTITRLGLPLSITTQAQRVFFTDVGHLYFLQIIIGIYLVLPLLHRFLKTQQQKYQLLVLCFVALTSMLFEYASFLLFKTYNQSNAFVIFLPFTTYALLGYYLAKIAVKPKQWWLIFISTLTLAGIISAASYLNTKAFISGTTVFWTPSGGNFFWEPFTLPIILLSVSIFVLFNTVETVFPTIFKSQKFLAGLASLSAASFGIYLIHPFVMEQIDHYFHFSIQFISYPLWIYYLQRIIYTFTASAVIVTIGLRIPYLKAIFGGKKI